MDSRFSKEDGGTTPLAPNPKKRNAWVICLSVFLGSFLFVFLLLLILGLTVFKAKDPTTTVNSVTVKHLESKIDRPPSTKVYLNVTLKLDMSVHNPNKASFKYRDTMAIIDYNGGVVGEAAIPAGKIPSDGTTGINSTITLMADRLLSDSKFYKDMISDRLPLTVSTTIAGKVKVLIIKKSVVAYTTCNMTLFISNQTVADSECRSKVSL
ncbi:late embryogenesis abundant protein At1g64065-like [Macadamia integrifolia]|uniref:late embryogenesis abundant protein At1g64065-like n=1 Tax=Macadamia integrifolia TaxID=60698 RepID=UPI001C4EDE98|nr:late embryogenesis abundant protein At1g64065-like [Macadamia integrifolia]